MTVPGDPEIESIGEARKSPPVCREGVGTREVLRRTVEERGGGRQ